MALSPITFAKQSYDELKKVVWPTKTEIIRLTVSVLVISAVVGVYLGGIDLIFTKIIETILK